MQLLKAFTFLTLAVSSAYGSVIDASVVDAALENVNLESRATCSTTDTNYIRTKVNHFNVFCQMYNAQSRTDSPFSKLNAARTTAACKCILAAWNGTPVPTSAPSASAQTCVAADANLIKNEYHEPSGFCTWWNLMSRTRSPIPGVSAAQVTKACKCYNASKGSTATTAKKVTTTTKKSSATTAPACKRRRARRSAMASAPAVTVAVPTDAPTLA